MPRQVQSTLSYLHAPLGDILRTASHVRILRVLTEYEHPIPPVELAHATRLDLSGVVRTIASLSETGIVRSIGVGRRRLIQFDASHYFAPALQQLFSTERALLRDLVDELQRAVQALHPMPRSAWIEGPHAVGADTARDLLRIGVLVNVRERQVTHDGLVEPLREIERRFGLTADLVLRTRADLVTQTPEQAEALGQVLLIHGIPPIHLVHGMDDAAVGAGAERDGQNHELTAHGDLDTVHLRDTRGPRTHAQLDLAARESAGEVVRAIKRDPRIVERAQNWIEHRLPRASEAERHELREWVHILSMPLHRISAFLLDPGERATRLRQTSPFRSVLKATDRETRVHSFAAGQAARREKPTSD